LREQRCAGDDQHECGENSVHALLPSLYRLFRPRLGGES
jgi:hypothetical protein